MANASRAEWAKRVERWQDCGNYPVNHREPLSRFLEDGRLRLDNHL